MPAAYVGGIPATRLSASVLPSGSALVTWRLRAGDPNACPGTTLTHAPAGRTLRNTGAGVQTAVTDVSAVVTRALLSGQAGI
jgi:hypothetical protein